MKSGVLLLDYYTDSMDSVLQHYKNQKSAYCYLLDADNQLLYHPFEKQIVSGLYKEKTIKVALASKNYKIYRADGERWMLMRQQIGYTGWNVVLVSSMSSLDLETRNLLFRGMVYTFARWCDSDLPRYSAFSQFYKSGLPSASDDAGIWKRKL